MFKKNCTVGWEGRILNWQGAFTIHTSVPLFFKSIFTCHIFKYILTLLFSPQAHYFSLKLIVLYMYVYNTYSACRCMCI